MTNEIEEYLYGTKCMKCGCHINIAFAVWSGIFRCQDVVWKFHLLLQ
jgi:hypothetical protein